MCVSILAALLAVPEPASAQLKGHYVPGFTGLNNGSQGPPALTVVFAIYFYTTDTLKDDDGVGFNVDVARRGGGLGLVSMEERARLIKGRFDVTSTPGRGSDVEVLVPAPLPDVDRSFTLA